MPTTESKDPLMTLPMLTPCPRCHGWHAHRCDKPSVVGRPQPGSTR